MTEIKEISYPNIAQSIGITGIIILGMLLFSPVILLDKLLDKQALTFIYYLLSVGIPFLIIHQIRKRKTGESAYNFDFSSIKIIVLVSIGTIAIQTGIISPITSLIPMPDSVKKSFIEFLNQNGVFLFLTLVIAAPLLEELIFRGIVLNGLLRKYSPLKSILVSSTLFGIVHLNPWQFIAALIAGLFSGWVYYKTNKLTLSIIIHLVNNLIVFIDTYFMDAETMMNASLTEQYGELINLIMVTCGAIMLTMICLYFLSIEFQKIEIKNNRTQQQLLKSDSSVVN